MENGKWEWSKKPWQWPVQCWTPGDQLEVWDCYVPQLGKPQLSLIKLLWLGIANCEWSARAIVNGQQQNLTLAGLWRVLETPQGKWMHGFLN